jgi:hypothetical protein
MRYAGIWFLLNGHDRELFNSVWVENSTIAYDDVFFSAEMKGRIG